jgi:hypothetical protein
MWHVGKVIALHDETATARTIILEVPGWPEHIKLREPFGGGF